MKALSNLMNAFDALPLGIQTAYIISATLGMVIIIWWAKILLFDKEKAK